jgi:hypothetical protein
MKISGWDGVRNSAENLTMGCREKFSEKSQDGMV